MKSIASRYCTLAALAAATLLASCTQRTITTRQRSYSIAGSESDDSDKMRERYATGFTVGEDGTMQSDKKELYEGKSFRNAEGNEKDLKSFRMGNKDLDMKEYRTPEYLTRQGDFRTKDSRMPKDARESDVERFTTAYGDQQARLKDSKPGFLDWLNPFSKQKDYRDSGRTYRTFDNRRGAGAIESAASPVPMSQIGAGPQDQRNTALSMDDVKKMVSPETYESPRN